MKKITTFFSIVGIFISCVCAGEKDIVILPEHKNKTYKAMLKELGTPADKTGYTIQHAPTKSWNHKELFSTYPRTEKNMDVQIMEVTWSLDESLIVACFHLVNGTNRCLVAKQMNRNIKH